MDKEFKSGLMVQNMMVIGEIIRPREEEHFSMQIKINT